jgi:hypothetical protein
LPELGRFLQADSIVPDAGSAKAYDRYAYVNNDPINGSDSTGRCLDGITTIPCILAAIAVAGFAGGAANYEYNVSGHSWWESKEDAKATFTAGMNGATTALTAAFITIEAVITGQDTISSLQDQFTSSFSGLDALPMLSGGDPENFETGEFGTNGISEKIPNPPINSKGDLYPQVDVEGFGQVPFPKDPFEPNNSRILRQDFTKELKGQFQEWWISKGRPWPEGEINIHHIKPLSFGGDNSFDNLIPLSRSDHQLFTNWWRNFMR